MRVWWIICFTICLDLKLFRGLAFTFISLKPLSRLASLRKIRSENVFAGVEVSGGSDVTWIGPQVTVGWGEGR